MIRSVALAALLASTALSSATMAQTAVPASANAPTGFATSDATDPYLWLEDVEGERAMEWVRAHNAHSLGVLQGLGNRPCGFFDVRDNPTPQPRRPRLADAHDFDVRVFREIAHDLRDDRRCPRGADIKPGD